MVYDEDVSDTWFSWKYFLWDRLWLVMDEGRRRKRWDHSSCMSCPRTSLLQQQGPRWACLPLPTCFKQQIAWNEVRRKQTTVLLPSTLIHNWVRMQEGALDLKIWLKAQLCIVHVNTLFISILHNSDIAAARTWCWLQPSPVFKVKLTFGFYCKHHNSSYSYRRACTIFKLWRRSSEHKWRCSLVGRISPSAYPNT